MKLGLFLLQKNTDPQRLLYVNETTRPVDYHGPLSESICELAVGSWLLGYWRLRQALSTRAEPESRTAACLRPANKVQ